MWIMKTFRKEVFMKRKFFTTLALFLSLALTSCGAGNNGNGGDTKWESDKNAHWHVNADGEVVDKVKHDLVEDTAKSVAATCKAEGKKVEVCSVCGFVKETAIKKLDHNFVADSSKTSVPAKCEEDGVNYFVCSACGEPKEEKLEKLGHLWDAGEITKPATCSEPGEKTFKCTRTGCNATRVEPVLAEHDFSVDVPYTKGEGEVDETIKKCSRDNTYQIKWSAQDASKEVSSSSAFNSNGKLGSQNAYVGYKFYSPFAMKVRLWINGTVRYNEWWDRANPDSDSQAVWFNYKDETNGNNWKYSIYLNGTEDANLINQDDPNQKVVGADGEVSIKEFTFSDLDINTEGLSESSSTEIKNVMMPWVEFDVLEGANTIRIVRTSGYTNYFTDFILIGSPAA